MIRLGGGSIKQIHKQESNITEKLKDLVKKRKRTVIVIKAGSIKNNRRTSSSSFESDYYPAYSE
jgi:hypothetical protein